MYVYVCIYVFYIFNLVSVLNITLQPSGFSQKTIGQRQDVICSVSVPPDVDPDTIELGWLNEDDIITDDSRVTINTSSDYFNNNTLVTIIQFDPLNEEDQDEYICYTIINGSFIYDFIDLQKFTSKQLRMYVHMLILHVYVCTICRALKSHTLCVRHTHLILVSRLE